MTYYAGINCQCYASTQGDCCCSDVDWTPTEVYRLRAENIQLGEQVKQLSSLIYNEALGKLAMNYSVDIEYMAEKTYEITGINAEGEVNEKK